MRHCPNFRWNTHGNSRVNSRPFSPTKEVFKFFKSQRNPLDTLVSNSDPLRLTVWGLMTVRDCQKSLWGVFTSVYLVLPYWMGSPTSNSQVLVQRKQSHVHWSIAIAEKLPIRPEGWKNPVVWAMHTDCQNLTQTDWRSSIHAHWMPPNSARVPEEAIQQRFQHHTMVEHRWLTLAEQKEHLKNTLKQKIESQIAESLFYVDGYPCLRKKIKCLFPWKVYTQWSMYPFCINTGQIWSESHKYKSPSTWRSMT